MACIAQVSKEVLRLRNWLRDPRQVDILNSPGTESNQFLDLWLLSDPVGMKNWPEGLRLRVKNTFQYFFDARKRANGKRTIVF